MIVNKVRNTYKKKTVKNTNENFKKTLIGGATTTPINIPIPIPIPILQNITDFQERIASLIPKQMTYIDTTSYSNTITLKRSDLMKYDNALTVNNNLVIQLYAFIILYCLLVHKFKITISNESNIKILKKIVGILITQLPKNIPFDTINNNLFGFMNASAYFTGFTINNKLYSRDAPINADAIYRYITHVQSSKKDGIDILETIEIKIPTGIYTHKNNFISLCNKYIMVNNIYGVNQSTHLTHSSTNSSTNCSTICNIFIIGETHVSYTQCKDTDRYISILKMFKDLINGNNLSLIPIDLLIEQTQRNTKHPPHSSIGDYRQNNANNVVLKIKSDTPQELQQIFHIRKYFALCVKDNTCKNVKIHWTDPYDFIIDPRTHQKTIPDWLDSLHTNFRKTTLQEHPQFITRADLSKLILLNPEVVTEINKATIQESEFTLDKAIKIFNAICDKADKDTEHANALSKYKNASEKEKLAYMLGYYARCVMDIYTVARIIQRKMTNVIFYAGNKHALNVIYILEQLGFKTVNKITDNFTKVWT